MIEALLLFGVGSLLAIGVATLVIAVITLRHARRYVQLAEESMERLRGEQSRLVALLLEERRKIEERTEQDREQSPTVYQLAGLEDILEEQGLRARPMDESRIEQLKQDLLKPRRERLEREDEERDFPPPPEEPPDAPSKPHELSTGEQPSKEQPRRTERAPLQPGFPETATQKASTESAKEDEKPRLATWHPHPDDDVSTRKESTEQMRALGDASLKMFRRHYDKYLENYEGYVKLAERLYRTQDGTGSTPDPLAEHEREERLRRVKDGIKRTTARLDILEEYNPELAADDRISRRASIAQKHAELERSQQGRP